MINYLSVELLKPPRLFEEHIERVSFWYKISRREILENMDIEELDRYAQNAMYYHLESLGHKPKRISRESQKVYEEERRARLRKQYGYED